MYTYPITKLAHRKPEAISAEQYQQERRAALKRIRTKRAAERAAQREHVLADADADAAIMALNIDPLAARSAAYRYEMNRDY